MLFTISGIVADMFWRIALVVVVAFLEFDNQWFGFCVLLNNSGDNVSDEGKYGGIDIV